MSFICDKVPFPYMGGWGGPKLLVKEIKHCFYGIFDHCIVIG